MKIEKKNEHWVIRVYDKKEDEEVYSIYRLTYDEAIAEIHEIQYLYHFGKDERFRVDLAKITINEVYP